MVSRDEPRRSSSNVWRCSGCIMDGSERRYLEALRGGVLVVVAMDQKWI